MPSFLRPTNLVPEHRLDLSASVPGHADLLERLGWSEPQAWVEHWQQRGGTTLALAAWPFPVAADWLWCVGFPLLTRLESCCGCLPRQLIGLSGLPGCGKSSLAKWIDMAASELDLSVSVVSLDDFYWPASEMDQAMRGNPWSVPRALPGSHDLVLIQECLARWRQTGELRIPQFDKSLRGGRGDRCGWQHSSADVLLLEGWFLGASPQANRSLDPELTAQELSYRQQALTKLEDYQWLWQSLDQLWHLRAPGVFASRLWKQQQEQSMESRTGVRLSTQELEGFIRMIETALPQESLQSINQADVVVELTDERVIRELR